MNAKELVTDYLAQTKIMQLATSRDGQPWACTVHFYADDGLNIYWMSKTDRRHSEDIKANPKVAVAVVGHENTATEKWIAGISIEGTAELLDDMDDEIAHKYISKQGHAPTLMDDIRAGRNPHRFYKLTPKQIILFDTKNFKYNPRQEIEIG